MSSIPAARPNDIPSTSTTRQSKGTSQAEQVSESTWLRKLTAAVSWYRHAVRDPETPEEKAEWLQISF